MIEEFLRSLVNIEIPEADTLEIDEMEEQITKMKEIISVMAIKTRVLETEKKKREEELQIEQKDGIEKADGAIKAIKATGVDAQ